MQRLTIVDKIYFQADATQNPSGASLGFTRGIQSDEVPYPGRPHLKAGESAKVDTGWVDKDVSYVLIDNQTEFAIEALFKEEVALVIRPGEHERLPVFNVDHWQLLSMSGDARPSVTVYPR